MLKWIYIIVLNIKGKHNFKLFETTESDLDDFKTEKVM